MSEKSSSQYHSENSFQRYHTQSIEEEASVDDLRTNYSKALNYIEALKLEKNTLKDTLELALCDTNPYNPQKKNFSSLGLASPKNTEKRMIELEQENQELKNLLETNSKRIIQLQKDNQEYLDKIQEIDTLQFENKELKVELNCLNQEFLNVSKKLSELEEKYKSLSTQKPSAKKNIEPSEKISISKYANYISQLVESIDKNHFSFCCFKERFSKSADFLSLVQSSDPGALLLKAFKYITDLLINVNSQYSVNNSRLYASQPETQAYVKSDNNLHFGDLSCITDAPETNNIRRAETPQDYHLLNSVETSNSYLSIKPNENQKRTKYSPESQRQYPERDGSGFDSKYSTARKDKGEPNGKSKPKRNDRYADEEGESPDYGGKRQGEQEKRHYNLGPEEQAEEPRAVTRFKDLKEKKDRDPRGPTDKVGKQAGSRDLSAERENNIELPRRVQIDENNYKVTPKKKSTADVSGAPSGERPERESNGDKRGPSGAIRSTNQSKQGTRDVSASKEKSPDEGSLVYKDLKIVANYEGPQSRKKSHRKLDSEESTARDGNGRGVKILQKASPRMRSPRETANSKPVSSTRKTREDIEDNSQTQISRISRKADNTHSFVSFDTTNKGTEYPSFTVSFWKTETKSKSSLSPPPRVTHIVDVPHKKKVVNYPPQSYDVIKGEELLRKTYFSQPGIVESQVVKKDKTIF